MPVWNRADLVRTAVESVVGQTFRSYELLIIDDGSEDDLAGAVQPYLSPSIILHQVPHIGISGARNLGLRMARHPFIAHLDSDNRWHPEYLATMHKALAGDAPREAAYCLADRYERDAETGVLRRTGTIGRPFDFRELLVGNYVDINTFVHSRKCIEYAGVFDEKLRRLDDWDLVIRIASLFEPVFVPKVLVDYHFGVAKNAVSLTEDLETADTAVRAKHVRFKEPVTFVHDTIPYTWDHLTPEKYTNWVRLHHEALNTTDYTAWGYPFVLQIEPTNLCNLSCPLCPAGRNELGRERRHMRLSEFKSVVDDMERYLLFLILWNWGEPFMNPELPQMIRYSSERGIKTVTSTNAHFLSNEEYVEAILRSGLSTLIVAIDSVKEKSYRVYRKRGSLKRALAGLRKLVEMKRRLGSNTLINMRTVVMRQNERELPKLRRLAREVGADRFTAKTLNPSCGDNAMDDELVPRNPRYRRYAYKPGTLERLRVGAVCRRVWEMSNIQSNGDVVPCCYDYDGTMKVGNAFEQPFTRIWNGPAYRELRRNVSRNMQSLPKCRNCGVNFQLSECGWFIESLDPVTFVEESSADRWRRRLRPPLGRRIIGAVRRRLQAANE